MGSRITRDMGFLPANWQFATPFRSQLTVRHRTDRQTDRQRPSTRNASALRGRAIIMCAAKCRDVTIDLLTWPTYSLWPRCYTNNYCRIRSNCHGSVANRSRSERCGGRINCLRHRSLGSNLNNGDVINICAGYQGDGVPDQWRRNGSYWWVRQTM